METYDKKMIESLKEQVGGMSYYEVSAKEIYRKVDISAKERKEIIEILRPMFVNFGGYYSAFGYDWVSCGIFSLGAFTNPIDLEENRKQYVKDFEWYKKYCLLDEYKEQSFEESVLEINNGIDPIDTETSQDALKWYYEHYLPHIVENIKSMSIEKEVDKYIISNGECGFTNHNFFHKELSEMEEVVKFDTFKEAEDSMLKMIDYKWY